MKKVPTLFERDREGNRNLVLNRVNPACQWVFDGEGVPTRKLDGSCCLVRGGVFFKRREVKKGDAPPPDFEEAGFDEETGKRVGWVPVGDSNDDKWFREAFRNSANVFGVVVPEGTCEAVGPHFQGNPEGYENDCLVPHDDGLVILEEFPRTFDGIRDYLSDKDIEGIVFHHHDGRMAKIKKRDFGLARKGGTR